MAEPVSGANYGTHGHGLLRLAEREMDGPPEVIVDGANAPSPVFE